VISCCFETATSHGWVFFKAEAVDQTPTLRQ
jgi:hypothetical protein